MTKFSEMYQPVRRASARSICRKGHSMVEGDPNVRIRTDGRRVCRECESNRRKESYLEGKKNAEGVMFPFTADNLHYSLVKYKRTQVDVLNKFYAWQQEVLNKAKQNPKGVWNTSSGLRLPASMVIETLEREMPVLYQHILSRVS